MKALVLRKELRGTEKETNTYYYLQQRPTEATKDRTKQP
jgi:hypothetical protein